jgi:hypothetical protein
VPDPRPRSAKRQFTASILVLEAFVAAFAALVAFGLRTADPAVVWGVGGALALSLVLAAGLVGRPGGYVVGSVLQAPLVAATAVSDPVMVVLGVVFVVLWVVALRLGGRIDREREEYLRREQAS